MRVKRVDFKKYCRDNDICIVYNMVKDEYRVLCLGFEITTKKTFLECEDFIYEMMLNDKYTNNR